MIALMPGSIRTLGSTSFSGRRNSARREKAPLAHILLPFSGMGFQGDNRAKRNEGVPDAVHAGNNCVRNGADAALRGYQRPGRSEEHTSELQSLMRISYAVFCLKKQ